MGEEEASILIAVSVILGLVIALITFFIIFLRRKNQLLRDQAEIKKNFEKELSKTQIEIREETMRNISWELHDNVGQLVSLAKINAQLVRDNPDKIDEVIDILGAGLNELRALSKIINPEAVRKMNLIESIQLEIDRYNRLDYLDSQIEILGQPKKLDSDIQVFIFRILQEFFTNTIKYSKAKTLKVRMDYTEETLNVSVIEDGIGFDLNSKSEGIGLINMHNRAKLIGADLRIESELGAGTSLFLKYEYH